jgi:hypothetical protein
MCFPSLLPTESKSLLKILRGLDWDRIERVKSKAHGANRKLSQVFRNTHMHSAVGFALGTTKGAFNSRGFSADGFNRNIIPKGLAFDQELLLQLWTTLKTLLKKYDPAFHFSSVQVNYNFPPLRSHIDRHDRDHQYALSLGRFRGGRLMVGTDDPHLLLSFDTKNRLTLCDARHPHWVTPYTGERFSLICYRVLGRMTRRKSNLTCVSPSKTAFPKCGPCK